MRISFRTVAAAALVVAAAAVAGTSLFAADDDDEAEGQAAAKAALDKAVARGKELFHSKDLGKKTCASCHENADKPKLDLTTRAFGYPAFSRKKNAVVTMGQKINEMLSARSGGKELDLASADLIALEAYVVSLKAK